MPQEQRTIVRVFLASPGDLASERRIARDVVDKFNKRWSNHLHLHIELMGWEDTLASYGRRPQDEINRDLAQCELFIGMLWHEWGTPNGRFDSGFEEEFRLAEKSFAEGARPTIHLLFKEVDKARLRDKGPGLTRVLAFQDEIRNKILWRPFETENDFRDRLESYLVDYVQKLAQPTGQPQEAPGEASEPVTDGLSEKAFPHLPPEAVAFLRAFASKAEQPYEDVRLDAVEIARLRLIGSLVKTPATEDDLLGVHDANVLFQQSERVDLTREEKGALLARGLANYSAQNVPYWQWLKECDGLAENYLATRTIFGLDAVRVGAFRLMTLLRLEIVEEAILPSGFYERYWFDGGASSSVREAALDYLSEMGTDEHLTAVREELDRANYQTRKAAIHALVSILSRQNVDAALEALIADQTETVEQKLIDRVFSRAERLSDDRLIAALSHRAASVRQAAAEILRNRNRVTDGLAEQMVNDSDPAVRLQGVLAVGNLGTLPGEDEARKMLVQRRKDSPNNFLSFADTEGNEQYEEFRRIRLRAISLHDLRGAIASASIFNQEPRFEEIRRAFALRGDELREATRDRFKSWFGHAIKELADHPTSSDRASRIAELESPLRKEWTRAALNIIVDRGDCQDLGLVREALRDGFVEVTRNDLNFFAACGEWSDISLVMKLSGGKSKGRGLASILSAHSLSEQDYLHVARVALAIGKDKLKQLLKMEADAKILAAMIANCSAASFKALSDVVLIELLKNDAETVRRETAIKAVLCLPKRRLSGLLTAHKNLETARYYNVGLWLDLGVSMERPVATAVARRSQGWQES